MNYSTKAKERAKEVKQLGIYYMKSSAKMCINRGKAVRSQYLKDEVEGMAEPRDR